MLTTKMIEEIKEWATANAQQIQNDIISNDRQSELDIDWDAVSDNLSPEAAEDLYTEITNAMLSETVVAVNSLI